MVVDRSAVRGVFQHPVERMPNRFARVANDACAEEFLAERDGDMSFSVRVTTRRNNH